MPLSEKTGRQMFGMGLKVLLETQAPCTISYSEREPIDRRVLVLVASGEIAAAINASVMCLMQRLAEEMRTELVDLGGPDELKPSSAVN